MAEFTKWIIKSFHASEFGDSPTLLGPDVSPARHGVLRGRTSPEDYPDGYLEGDDAPDDLPPASNDAKDEL